MSPPAPRIPPSLAAAGEIALFRVAGELHAIADSRRHAGAGASLVSGYLDGTTLACSAHGLRFDSVAGGRKCGGALVLRRFPVRESDARIEIEIDLDDAANASSQGFCQ